MQKLDKDRYKDKNKNIGLFCIFQINIEGNKREQLQFTVKLTACDRLDKLDIPHIFQIRYRAK